MAEQYAPIAKDSSLNTTDLTPKNIADVLQDGLATLASSVKPTASDIPFDNTGTSLVSDDVQGAIEEVRVKSLQVTANTGSGGAIALGFNDSARKVLNCIARGYTVIPYVTGSGNYFATVYVANTTNPVQGTNVTVTVFYV